MTQPRSAPPELPGFTLVRGIGGGGFADVFLYNQVRPFREVAVKVLRAEHLSETSLEQFATEADVMAQVSAHPFIVTIFTAGVAPDGRPYIVMEHYPNPHFGLRARGGRLPLSEVLRTGVQVASAVEAAHRAGILHRDIKPANILTSEYNRPGLTDFGISGVRSDTEMKAAAGVTLAYSSPEVLLDEHAGGTEASDIYSLCATIYSLLAGHSPSWEVGGDNRDAAVLHRVVNGIIPPISRGNVPRSLDNLLRNGLAPDPAVRPTSALALARALQTIEQELSLAPTPLEIRGLPSPTTISQLTREAAHEADHGDRTRSSPAVVRPEPGPSPLVHDNRSVAGAPIVASPPPPAPYPPPSYPPPAGPPLASRPPVTSDDDTVLRPPAPAPAPPPSTRRRVPVAVLVAAVVLAGTLAVVAAFVATRGDDTAGPTTTTTRPTEPTRSTSSPTTTTTAARPQPSPLSPRYLETPPAPKVTRSPAGAVMIDLGRPPVDGLVFMVYRMGEDFADGKPYEETPGGTLAVLGIPQAEVPCYQVRLRVPGNGVISEKSTPACAVPR